MKKLLITAGIILSLLTACNNNTEKNTETTPDNNTITTEAQRREKEIADSTKLLDKQLADPNYKPDSLY